MNQTMNARTWTNHRFQCRGCLRTVRASQEAIDQAREGTSDTRSDAEIAAGFDLCLACLEGTSIEGECITDGTVLGEQLVCGLGCDAAQHCEGCDWCDATTRDRLAYECGTGRIVVARWCDDCVAVVNAGDGDGFERATDTICVFCGHRYGTVAGTDVRPGYCSRSCDASERQSRDETPDPMRLADERADWETQRQRWFNTHAGAARVA